MGYVRVAQVQGRRRRVRNRGQGRIRRESGKNSRMDSVCYIYKELWPAWMMMLTERWGPERTLPIIRLRPPLFPNIDRGYQGHLTIAPEYLTLKIAVLFRRRHCWLPQRSTAGRTRRSCSTLTGLVIKRKSSPSIQKPHVSPAIRSAFPNPNPKSRHKSSMLTPFQYLQGIAGRLIPP